MRALVLFTLCLGPICSPGLAWGHGIPIDLSLHSGKLSTDHQVYTSTANLIAGVIVQTDLPGFGVTSSANNVPAHLQIGVDVLDKLYYWNGTDLADPTASLLVENQFAHSVTVTGSTAFQPGISVGTYNGSLGWHAHLFYVLEPLPVSHGAYGLLMSATASGVENSDPFLIVFNYGLSSGDFNTGVAAIADAVFAVPEPSSIILLGLGGVGLAVSAWRRSRHTASTVHRA